MTKHKFLRLLEKKKLEKLRTTNIERAITIFGHFLQRVESW